MKNFTLKHTTALATRFASKVLLIPLKEINISSSVFGKYLSIAFLFLSFVVLAQPGAMSVNQDVSGTYTNTTMTTVGKGNNNTIFRAQFTEGTGQSSGVRNWQFNSDGYSNTWGARAANTLVAYNTAIVANTGTASANWANSCSPSCYNSFGKLPATTSSRNYIYNIRKGTGYGSQDMAVLELAFTPRNINSYSTIVNADATATVSVTMSGALSTGEYLYVAYSTDAFATSGNSGVVAVGALNGSFVGSANVPAQSVNSTVTYYPFTSTSSSAPSFLNSPLLTIRMRSATGENDTNNYSTYSFVAPIYFNSGHFASPNSFTQSASTLMTTVVGKSSNTYSHTTNSNISGNQFYKFYSATTGGTYFGPDTNVDIPYNINSKVTLETNAGSNGKSYYLNNTSNLNNIVFKTSGFGTASQMVVFNIAGAVRSVSSATNTAACAANAVTVTANLSGAFSSGQGAYLRYSTSSTFATSSVVAMTGTGTTYTADIPLGTNVAGVPVYYYVFTSGNSGPASNGVDADLYSINLTTTNNYTPTASPTPTFTSQAGASACANTDVTYTTQAGQSSYVWTYTGTLGVDYSITSGGGNTNSVTLKWLTTGSKTVTINYTTSGCTAVSATSSTATTVTSTTTTIAPSGTQNIAVSVNGALLTVSEGTNSVTSRVWKYGTVSGAWGTSTGVTATTYTPNFASSGTYYVVCQTTYAAPCSVTVTSNEVIINVASSDVITTGTITGAPFCAGTTGISVPFTYSVAANFPSSTFKAQLSNASGSFASPIDLQTVASDASGSQSISVTIPSGTATGSGYRIRVVSNAPAILGTDNGSNLVINALPTIAAAGADQTGSATCGLTSVTLAGNSATVGTGAWSIISGTGGTVTTPSSNTSTFTGTAGTTYTLRWTISAITPCAGSTDDDVVITFNRNPTTATNGSTQSICTTGTATLSGNNPTVGTGAWTVVSGPSTSSAQFTSASVYNTVFTPAGGAGSYVVRWTISSAPCTASTANATITVTAVPTPTFTVQPGATACTNTDVTYTTQSGQSNYVWNVPGVLSTDYSITSGGIGTGSNTVTLKWLTTGSKTVTINYTTSGCTAASATSSTATTVSTTTAGTATATASSVCLGGSTTITLTGHTGTIQWQKSENGGTSWINITGATSATYTTSSLNVASSFRAQVTSGTCGTVSSTVATVTISNVNQSNAGNATYNTTWANAQNDSTTGFGAWVMSASGSGGFYSSGSSDVNNANTRSWGMYAGGTGGSNSASATRTVSMGIGNTIGFSMDNGVVTSGGTVGFGLQNASGQNLMELYFVGGASNYTLNDNAGAVATSIAYTTAGLDITVSYTGANTYSVNITVKGGATVTYTGRTFSTRGGGQVPAQIRFFNAGAGNGSTYDLFFNSLSINNPVITTQPTNTPQSYCIGATPTNLTVVASGTGLTYQWYSNPTASNTGGTSLGSGRGAQTATYTPQNTTANVLYYYSVVTGSCGSTTSKVSGAITVSLGSTAAVLSGTASICSGNSTNLQVAITGGTSPYTVVYYNGTSNITVNSYVSGTNIPVSPTSNTSYSLVSVTSTGGCIGTGNSGTPIVTIVSAPTITLETNALLICKGTTSASLVYTATTGSPNQYSIDYDATANSAGFTDVTNVTLPSSPIVLTIPASANGTYNATLTVKNTTTGCISSSYSFTVKTATLDGYNLQYWDQAPGPNRACEGGGVFVFGQVYIAGVTSISGQAVGVGVEFGYNTTNNDPAVGANGWTWTDASNNYDNDKDSVKDEYKTNFIPPAPGTYYFAYRYKLNGCGWNYAGYRENWNVVDGPAVWNSTTLSGSTFGSGSVIIANAVAAANAGPAITQCNNGTFTMAANAVASPAIGTWTVTSGTATITSPNSPTTTITGVAAGASATLRWTIVNTGCNSTNSSVVLTNSSNNTWSGVTSIDWNTASNWSCGGVPTATSVVVIPSGTPFSPSIYQTANGLAKTVTINSGATLSMSNAYELTLSTAGGFTNNGTFSAGNGTVSFLGTGSIAGTTATTFNNVTIAGGVNFGTTATVVGNLKINNGGYVDTNAPTYSNTATLVYNTGATYNRGLEWSTTSGAGYPNNITIQGNTILNVSNGVPGYKKAAGNLTVASGSQFFMNNAKLASITDRTVVDGIRGIGVQFLGDISNSGSILLRGTTDSRLKCDDFVNETGGITSLIAGLSNVGADLEVTGHFTDNGNFGSNERAVFFTGPATQIISGTATPPFNIDYVVVKKPASSGVVRMDQDLLIGGPTLSAAIVFGSANDIIDLNGKTLTVGTATVASNILGGNLGMFKGSASGSNIILNGDGDIGTISFEKSNPGTSNNIDTFTVNRTGAGGGVTIGSDVNVKTTVTLTAGTINLASANMTVGAAGTIAVTSPSATKMIIASGTGELRKTFSTAGSFTYPIGDNTATAEYSPVTLNFTAGTFGGYAGVRVVDAIHPNNTVTDIALTRYWPVTSTITSPTCSASFVYLDADIVGVESDYYGGRYKAGWFCLGAVTTASNTITGTVSDFGDFTAGVFNPTAATISRSGADAVCTGNSSAIQVAVTGQTSPYTLVYSDNGGSTTYTVNNYVSGTDIPVTPLTTKTYSIVSVTSGNACIGTGISGTTVTVTVGGTTTWTGTWSSGAPTSTTAAIMSSNYNISTNIDACSLTVNSNAIAVIPSGYNVTLSGALTVEQGSSFTLENSANLIQSGTTNPNSGKITAKRNSSSLYLLDYTMWSSPVENQNLWAFSPNTLSNRFYTYNTATNMFNPISANENFEVAKGYLIRVPKNYSSYTPAVYEGNFIGKPNSGNIIFPMSSAGSGFNAVGNPYPSQINVHNFIDANLDMDGTIYFWRKRNDMYETSYATLNKSAYTRNGADGGDTGSSYYNSTSPVNWVINTGQGFIVKATDNANLVFTNGMRRGTNNSNQFFRMAKSAVVEPSQFKLNLTSTDGIFNQMALLYSPEYTLGYDRGYDSRNIASNNYITSIIDGPSGGAFTIQSRPEFVSNDVVALEYKVSKSGSYTITLDVFDGLFQTQGIYIKDKLNNNVYDLKSGAFTFQSEVGSFDNRFEIIYVNPSLAVDLNTFTSNNVIVYKKDHEVVINSGNTIMENVKVYDVRGRLLLSKNNINASEVKFSTDTTNQVLLVRITSDQNEVVTRKIVN